MPETIHFFVNEAGRRHDQCTPFLYVVIKTVIAGCDEISIENITADICFQVNILRGCDREENETRISIRNGRFQFYGPTSISFCFLDNLFIVFDILQLVIRKWFIATAAKEISKPAICIGNGTTNK